MARSSTVGYLRQYGSSKTATPAVFLSAIQFSFDPTQATAGTGKFLPIGAIPVYVASVNPAATGGASPTVDIGTQANSSGFGEELPADSGKGQLDPSAALLGITLTANTEIYAGVGLSAATGGTVSAVIYYLMSDDGGA